MARLTSIDLDVKVLRGDSATITLGLTRKNEQGATVAFPIADLTHEVWLTVKDDTSLGDDASWIQKRLGSPGDMAIRAAPNDWIVDVGVSAGETAVMEPKTYFYDAQVKVLASGEVRTMAIGRFIVLPDVTRAT